MKRLFFLLLLIPSIAMALPPIAELPPVTSANNDELLTVVGGKWTNQAPAGGALSSSGSPVAGEYAKFTDSSTIEGVNLPVFYVDQQTGADDDDKCQAAVDAAVAAGGGIVEYGSGTYTHNETIEIGNSSSKITGVYIRGQGVRATKITRSTDYGPTFRFANPNAPASGTYNSNYHIHGVGISDMFIQQTTTEMTDGDSDGYADAHVHFYMPKVGYAKRLRLDDGNVGVLVIDSNAQFSIDKVYPVYTGSLYTVTEADAGVKIISNMWIRSQVFISRCEVLGGDLGTNTYLDYGYYVDGADTVWFTDSYAGACGIAAINLHGNSDHLMSGVRVSKCWFDINGDEDCYGILMDGTTSALYGDIHISDTIFNGAEHATNGIKIDSASISDVTISNNSIYDCDQHGINIAATGGPVLIANNSIHDNCKSGTSYNGVNIAANIDDVTITGNAIKDGHQYGIYIADGDSDNIIIGVNNISGNNKGDMLDASGNALVYPKRSADAMMNSYLRETTEFVSADCISFWDFSGDLTDARGANTLSCSTVVSYGTNEDGDGNAVVDLTSGDYLFSYYTTQDGMVPTDEFSIFAKVLISADSNTSVMWKWATGNRAYKLNYMSANSAYQFGISSTGSDETLAYGTSIDSGKWHNVCGVYDGVNMTVYTDGVAGTPTAFTDGVNQSSTSLFYLGNPQTCKIDYAGIIDRALTPAEIKVLSRVNDKPGFRAVPVTLTTAGFDVEVADANKLYTLTIAGLTANRTATLPAFTGSGLKWGFAIVDGDDTYDFLVDPDGTDQILTTSAAGDYLGADDAGDFIIITDIASGVGLIESKEGTWTEE
jgi:hypothetical protein